MPKTVRDVLGALFVGLFCSLAAFSLGAIFSGNQPQQRSQSCAQNPQKQDQYALSEPFWQRTTTDPVAFFTLWLTVFTAVLAVSTIGLWIVTWRGTRTQASDMKESVEASKRAADIAERSLRELNRAFVFVKEIKPAPSATEGAIDIWIVWENNGTTQTKSMRTLTMSAAVTPAIPKEFDYPDDIKEKPGAASLGPKGTLSAAPITLSSEMLSDLASGKRQFLVWGWVEYDDIFADTKRHRTEFAAELKVTGVAGGQSYAINPIARRNYNGSDEECGSRFIRAQKNRPRIVAADQDLGPLTQVATAIVSDTRS